jgi:hypothetical protein
MEVVVLQSEAYNQLQQSTFSYMRKLMEQERKKSYIEWLDNNDAAALLKVSKRTLQAWRDEGLLTFSSMGGKIFYNREDIDRMLLSRSQKAFTALA